jgi:hypothetical protein
MLIAKIHQSATPDHVLMTTNQMTTQPGLPVIGGVSPARDTTLEAG